MTQHSIVIKTGQIIGGKGSQVLLDGEDISSMVRGITFAGQVGDIAAVTLDLLVHEVTVDGQDARIWLPDETREILMRHGWTPPAE